jgi:hypothetical protein
MEEEPELSPADASIKAMQQVTAPIVAITLVLLSVFVPSFRWHPSPIVDARERTQCVIDTQAY